MRLLTGTDIIDFHNGRDDLLALTQAGEFVTLDHADLTDRTDAYSLTTTHDDVVVTVLLERDTIDGGDWFADALDGHGYLDPEAADEMAAIINNDAGLHTRAAVEEIREATAAWEASASNTNRLASNRARLIANFAKRCGSQSAAARLLDLDQSTVNKLVKKAQTA
jgi:hypothetical protein